MAIGAISLCAPYLSAAGKFFGSFKECRLAQGHFKRLKYYDNYLSRNVSLKKHHMMEMEHGTAHQGLPLSQRAQS
jgi:hypothetical protein